MVCARCLSNEGAIEEAMKGTGIEEFKDKLREDLTGIGTFVVLPIGNGKSVMVILDQIKGNS